MLRHSSDCGNTTLHVISEALAARWQATIITWSKPRPALISTDFSASLSKSSDVGFRFNRTDGWSNRSNLFAIFIGRRQNVEGGLGDRHAVMKEADLWDYDLSWRLTILQSAIASLPSSEGPVSHCLNV